MKTGARWYFLICATLVAANAITHTTCHFAASFSCAANTIFVLRACRRKN